MKQYDMYINGEWCQSESGRTYEAVNPATGEAFATVPLGTRGDARKAIEAANVAYESWSKVPLWERAELCVRMADIVEKRVTELEDALCTEAGKPRHSEAREEPFYVLPNIRNAAEQAKWLEGSTIPTEDPHKRVLSFRRPRGVVAVITPWNFPANIPCEYLPYAMVMGNTVVWTPAPTTAVVAVTMMEMFVEAGVPKGVLNLVIGPGPEVGDELVVNPGTHAIGMTGSSKTGQIISSRCGLKPRLFELGGNGPTVVLADADPEQAAKAIAPACFYAAGQVCSSTERILVAEEIKKPFVEAMAAETANWVQGDVWDEGVNMGPQNNPAVLGKIMAHLEDAVSKGATVVAGGKRPDLPGFFYEPTVLVDYTPDSLVNQEETFGPVAPIASFRTDDVAWRYIDACNLGLSSAVFTSDVDRAWYWAERLKTGLTMVNAFSNYWELHLPFGGRSGTQSGIGRIGGRHTLEFMSEIHTIAFHVP